MKWLHITPEIRIAVFEKSPRRDRSKKKPWESNKNPYREIPNEELLNDLYELTIDVEVSDG